MGRRARGGGGAAEEIALDFIASLFAQAGNCQGTYEVFDGARRYDLKLAQGGYADLDGKPNSYYAGSATACTATPELVAGFQQSALKANLYPQSATLWMAPAIAGFPTVPVRILAQSAFGEVTLEVLHCPGHTPGHLCFAEANGFAETVK